jgi:hypothetical protein
MQVTRVLFKKQKREIKKKGENLERCSFLGKTRSKWFSINRSTTGWNIFFQVFSMDRGPLFSIRV